MSHNLTSRMPPLPSRLLHAPLRLKVMAGVVVVTLAALAVFDVGVVTIMRRYLLTQTANNLHLALTETEPRLSSLVSKGAPAPLNPAPLHLMPLPGGLPYKKHVPASGFTKQKPINPALLGDFEIAFVPWRGRAVILESGAVTVGSQSFILMQSDVARRFARLRRPRARSKQSSRTVRSRWCCSSASASSP